MDMAEAETPMTGSTVLVGLVLSLPHALASAMETTPATAAKRRVRDMRIDLIV
jgi:hypothetical protein